MRGERKGEIKRGNKKRKYNEVRGEAERDEESAELEINEAGE